MIKIVVLDLDGVYFLNSHENFKKNMEETYGLSRKEIERVYFESQEMKDYKLGKINGQEFWNWAIKEWGIDAGKEEVLKVLTKGYEINPKAKELVDKINEKGIKAAICSNNFPERIISVDKKLDFLKDFKIKVFSYEIGLTKSDPKIFEELVRKSGVKPEEIVYFDDSEKNVEVAKDIGIQAFFCKGFNEIEKILNDLGVL